MSIEALPDKLLLHIFNHLSWRHLSRDVSLVSRRWYRVVGKASLTSKTTLNLSRSDRDRITRVRGDYTCIPVEVLRNSSREYTKFCCTMQPLRNEQMIDGTLGTMLEYCQQRWNIQMLRLRIHYDQFILFMLHHKDLLNNVLKVNLVVKEIQPSDGTGHDAAVPHNLRFELSMNKLDFEHVTSHQSRPYILAVVAPNLETLNIRRCVMRNNACLELNHCPNLRSIFLFSRKPVRGANIPDPVELENVVSQSMPHFYRLKLINVPMTNTFTFLFCNLRYIYLAYVRIDATDQTLNCENLTELVVHSLLLQNPLKLKTPRLQILNCDMEVLKLLHLQDAIRADRLIIDMCYPSAGRSMGMANLSGLSHFRRLLLKPGKCYCYDATWFISVWSHLFGLVELEVREQFSHDHLDRMQDLLGCFSQISLLRLHGMNIPSDLRFLPSSVKTIHIEDCSVVGSSLQFLSSVESVRVRKLWNMNESVCWDIEGMELQPLNQFQPLEFTQVFHTTDGPRRAYSTLEEHQSGTNIEEV